MRLSPAILRLLVFFGGILVLAAIMILLSNVALPLLVGLGIAYVLDPIVSWFERRGHSRTKGVVVLAVGLLVVLVGGVLVVLPAINEQVHRLTDRMPVYAQQLQTELGPRWQEIQERYPTQIADLTRQATDAVKAQLPKMAQKAGEWIAGLLGSVVGLFVFILNLLFIPVFAFYLLVDFPKLRHAAVELVPMPYRSTTLGLVGEINQAVSSFLRGQLTIALILATIQGIGLTVIGVPLGLVVGIVAGIANLIPYMTLVVGLVPAMLLCWIEHQSLARVIAVALVFAGANMLEGMVLSPRILGNSVNLHPVWIMLSLILGGTWFGIVGMLLAVPVAASIQVFARHIILAYKRSEVFIGDEDYGQPPDGVSPPPRRETAVAADSPGAVDRSASLPSP